MKKLLLALLALSSVNALAAPALHCLAQIPGGETGDEGNWGMLIGETFEASCANKFKQVYKLRFFGLGAAFRVNNEAFILSCPLVRDHKLEGNYGGIKVSAAAGFGVDGAVLSNKRLGVCFLAGVSVGLGASATAGYLKIENDPYGDLPEASFLQ